MVTSRGLEAHDGCDWAVHLCLSVLSCGDSIICALDYGNSPLGLGGMIIGFSWGNGI